jgi:hypothetical protein
VIISEEEWSEEELGALRRTKLWFADSSPTRVLVAALAGEGHARADHAGAACAGRLAVGCGLVQAEPVESDAVSKPLCRTLQRPPSCRILVRAPSSLTASTCPLAAAGAAGNQKHAGTKLTTPTSPAQVPGRHAQVQRDAPGVERVGRQGPPARARRGGCDAAPPSLRGGGGGGTPPGPPSLNSFMHGHPPPRWVGPQPREQSASTRVAVESPTFVQRWPCTAPRHLA